MPLIDAARIRRLAKVWQSHVESGRIVGGMLLVAEQGELRFASALGWADRENRRRVTPHTQFRLASLTKLLTSVLALRLCESGRLTLDEPVTRWLADFRPRLADGAEATITLRHLLSHTAGLSYGFEQPVGNAYERAGVSDGLDHVGFDLQHNLTRLAGLPLLFKPGEAWGYSLATDVVGAIIEQASGVSLPQAIARWVTQPLAMSATGFVARDDQSLAVAYRDASSEPLRIGRADVLKLDSGQARLSATRVADPQAYPSAGAGLIGTAEDYLKLLECLRAGGAPLLSPASTASLLSNAICDLPISNRGPGWKFALGPMVLTDPGLARHKQGSGTWSWCGLYGCHYWVDPAAGISLVALTNTAVTGAWGGFADALVDALYDAE